MAAFGFSVGDFLAAIDLVKDLVEALSETSGAKVEYQDLMSQLYILEKALIIVKGLNPSVAEYQALLQAVEGCQHCISAFLKRVEKCQSLSAGPTSIRDQARKIKWALCHKDDVQYFKESLKIRTQSLLLMINATELAHSVASTDQTKQLLADQTALLTSLRISSSDDNKLQSEILENLNKLVLAEERRAVVQIPIKNERKFEIRPFKLVGAPLITGFVERREIMRKIEAVLLPIDTSQQTVLVLQGLGGIGKSQLARQYATRHKDEYSSVFWINAMSQSSLTSSITEVARRVGLTIDSEPASEGNRLDGVTKTASAVLDWLDSDGNTNWLLIFDNLDSQIEDEEDKVEERGDKRNKIFDASRYLPATTQGSIIITSRLSYVARQFGGSCIFVDRMSTDEGLEVISNLSEQSSENDSGRALVEKLGAYPLALSQAGRFMYETQSSYKSFLRLYDTRISDLMKQKPSKREYQNGSIKVALQISFDALKDRDLPAAALLILFGCFNNADIFSDLINYEQSLPEECYPQPPPLRIEGFDKLSSTWLEGLSTGESHYRDAIRSLLAFSFVTYDMALERLTIHPVVHEWVTSLSAGASRSNCLQTATHLLANRHSRIWRDGMLASPMGRDILSRMRPHIDRCMGLIKRNLCQNDIIPGDLVLIGTYYLYQYEQHVGREWIDIGLSMMDEGMLATKAWFYIQVLRMYLEGGWQTGDDRISFIRRIQRFVDSNHNPATFKWSGGKDVVEEQLFGALFISYLDERMFTDALELARRRLAQVEVREDAQYSIHAAKVCLAGALVETGAPDKAVEIGEECTETLREWQDGLSSEAKESDNMFDHAEWIAKDLYWVLGKAYTALGQQEKGEQYLNQSLIAYADLGDNNTGDLLRVGHDYNDNQSLKAVIPDVNDRWNLALRSIGQQMRYPPNMAQILLRGLSIPGTSKTKLHRFTSDVLVAVRARQGTIFYENLLKKNEATKAKASSGLKEST